MDQVDPYPWLYFSKWPCDIGLRESIVKKSLFIKMAVDLTPHPSLIKLCCKFFINVKMCTMFATTIFDKEMRKFVKKKCPYLP